MTYYACIILQNNSQVSVFPFAMIIILYNNLFVDRPLFQNSVYYKQLLWTLGVFYAYPFFSLYRQ